MSLTTAANQILQALPMEEAGEIPEAYWKLMERYRGELIHQAVSILGDYGDAEDVVQDAFCVLFRNRAKLTEIESLGAWLRAVNRNTALRRLRDRRRAREGAQRKQRELPERAATTGGFGLLEIREAVERAIKALPADLREVMVLRYWEHLTHDEIAKRLSLPAGTVRWMVWDASMRLHPHLQQLLQAPEPCALRRPSDAKTTSTPGEAR